MCGIVGAIAQRPVVSLLLEGLKKLEYRGYDSAGLALVDSENTLTRYRVVGKVSELEKVVLPHHCQQKMGIAHTRWATHGALKKQNAHPFVSHDEFALVHNGIIENNFELRQQLIQDGYQFSSETDSEVIVHLIHYHFQRSHDVIAAIYATTRVLKGAYALGILSAHYPTHLFAVRQGSPLVIGKGRDEVFLASDALAVLSVAQDFIYLEEGDVVDLACDDIRVFDHQQQRVLRAFKHIAASNDITERGEYRHYIDRK